mmetsp:Transcript_28950/g.78412  ORF Transcript_28950/g.78412 Transcript_28950/m.78412 type:complete len:395 (+) Transcript_28950:363-1547(+)
MYGCVRASVRAYQPVSVFPCLFPSSCLQGLGFVAVLKGGYLAIRDFRPDFLCPAVQKEALLLEQSAPHLVAYPVQRRFELAGYLERESFLVPGVFFLIHGGGITPPGVVKGPLGLLQSLECHLFRLEGLFHPARRLLGASLGREARFHRISLLEFGVGKDVQVVGDPARWFRVRKASQNLLGFRRRQELLVPRSLFEGSNRFGRQGRQFLFELGGPGGFGVGLLLQGLALLFQFEDAVGRSRLLVDFLRLLGRGVHRRSRGVRRLFHPGNGRGFKGLDSHRHKGLDPLRNLLGLERTIVFPAFHRILEDFPGRVDVAQVVVGVLGVAVGIGIRMQGSHQGRVADLELLLGVLGRGSEVVVQGLGLSVPLSASRDAAAAAVVLVAAFSEGRTRHQ